MIAGNAHWCRLLGVIIVLVIVIHPFLCWRTAAEERHATTEGTAAAYHGTTIQPWDDPNRPLVIWYHNIHRDSPFALRTALSSGVITSVMVKAVHRNDFARSTFAAQKYRIAEAVTIARVYQVGVIWSRPLWPLYEMDGFSLDRIYDPNYYVSEIGSLRAEGRALGAIAVGLDTEPYANSPVNNVWRGNKTLTAEEEGRLVRIVEEVLRRTGPVDIVYPAGAIRQRGKHMATVLARLGRLRISGDTYYDVPDRIASINYPYEIFGAYINTTRINIERPHLPRFRPQDIFDKQDWWLSRRGVFLYPMEHQAAAVAAELVRFAASHPEIRGTKAMSSSPPRTIALPETDNKGPTP
jgi:hypothetical protein